MMNTLYGLPDPIPALYVKSLNSWAGPQYAVQAIFKKARETAPCYLIFEDLDSLISDNVRSYFLNEVDGLGSNDGIYMVGSTNHLERLDPGISKVCATCVLQCSSVMLILLESQRPSRFDRKYEFTKPDLAERTKYCDYWRGKLADNEDVAFPSGLSKAIAGITDGFSFAFLQEAFIASLLAIAAHEDESEEGSEDDDSDDSRRANDEEKGGDGNYEDSVLWKEMQKQVKILREQM